MEGTGSYSLPEDLVRDRRPCATPQRRRVKALRWLNPRLRPSAGRSPPVRQPQGSAGGGESPASAGIAGRCRLAASDTLGHESGSGADSRRRAGLTSSPGSSETPGDAVVGGLGRGANDTAGRAVYRVLVTVGVPLEVLGTNAQRMKSDSWQLRLVNVTAIRAPSSCAARPERGGARIAVQCRGAGRLSRTRTKGDWCG
jgi:hypothetical protein